MKKFTVASLQFVQKNSCRDNSWWRHVIIHETISFEENDVIGICLSGSRQLCRRILEYVPRDSVISEKGLVRHFQSIIQTEDRGIADHVGNLVVGQDVCYDQRLCVDCFNCADSCELNSGTELTTSELHLHHTTIICGWSETLSETLSETSSETLSQSYRCKRGTMPPSQGIQEGTSVSWCSLLTSDWPLALLSPCWRHPWIGIKRSHRLHKGHYRWGRNLQRSRLRTARQDFPSGNK